MLILFVIPTFLYMSEGFKQVLHVARKIVPCNTTVRSLGIGTVFFSNRIGNCANTQWTHFSCGALFYVLQALQPFRDSLLLRRFSL